MMDAGKPPRETWKADAKARSSTTEPGADAIGAVRKADDVPIAVTQSRQNAYAIVIGIEDYRERLPRAEYAVNDAKRMGEHLVKVLGYPEKNVVVRLNEKAGKADLEKYLGPWLRNNVEAGGDVFVYYSGHGAPNPKTNDAYLVPYDGDPTYLETTAYPVKRLYEDLAGLPAREILVMLDSCFSGAGGRSVIAKGAKPLVITAENALSPPKKITVLSASSGDQISMAFGEKEHGLFTYYFLQGLQKGDYTDSSGNLKIRELFEFVKPQVELVARKQYNTEQTPQLVLSSEAMSRR